MEKDNFHFREQVEIDIEIKMENINDFGKKLVECAINHEDVSYIKDTNVIRISKLYHSYYMSDSATDSYATSLFRMLKFIVNLVGGSVDYRYNNSNAHIVKTQDVCSIYCESFIKYEELDEASVIELTDKYGKMIADNKFIQRYIEPTRMIDMISFATRKYCTIGQDEDETLSEDYDMGYLIEEYSIDLEFDKNGFYFVMDGKLHKVLMSTIRN